MINNPNMYDQDKYIKCVQNINDLRKKKLISDEDQLLIESALRNQCIILKGTDLGEPSSYDDFILAGKILSLIESEAI